MIRHDIVVVLVNFNNLEDTLHCVRSINEHEQGKPFVIIVDNASKDAQELSQIQNEYSNSHVIYNPSNFGFGKANNIGVDWANNNIEYDYIALLNNDTSITFNSLTRLANHFDITGQIGIVTSRIMYADDPNLVWYGGANINHTKGWPAIIDFNQQASSSGALQSKFVDFASGCLMMFSANSIRQIGGFDERFFMYMEDLELCLRSNKLGLNIYYDGTIVIHHKVQGSLKSSKNYRGLHPKNPNLAFQFYHRKVNQWFTFKKHSGSWQFFKFASYFILRYNWDLLKLLIRSPYRWKVLKVHFCVWMSIFTGKIKPLKTQ